MSFGRVQAPDYYYIYSHCLTPALCSCCFCSSMKSPGGHWVTPVRQRETPSASDRRSQSPVPLHTSTDRTFFSSKNIPTFPSNIISRPLIQSHFPPCVARRVDHFALPFASSLRTLQRLPAYPTAMMNALKSPKYHDLRDREAHPAESPEENNSLMTDHDGEVEKAWSDDTARDHPAMVSLRKSRRQKIKSAVMSFRSILDTVLLLVILALVVDRRWGASTRLEFAGDLTGFAPRFSQQIKKFAPDHDFVPENATDFFSTRTLRKWLGTVPGELPPRICRVVSEP